MTDAAALPSSSSSVAPFADAATADLIARTAPGSTLGWITLARIDWPTSLARSPRVDGIDADTVTAYADVMDEQQGWGAFPPAIAIAPAEPTGPVVLLSGFHRCQAANLLGFDYVPAYLVDVDSEAALLLGFDANASHGRPLTLQDRAETAAHLVLDHGYATGDAAARCGTTPTRTTQVVSAMQAASRAEQVGIVGFDSLARQVQYQLGRIDNPGVFRLAARTVVDRRMGGGSVQRMVEAIGRADSPAEASQIVMDIADARSSHAGGRGNARNPRTLLVDSLIAVRQVDPDDAAADVETPEQAMVLRDRLIATARHLMAIDASIASAFNLPPRRPAD